MELDAKYEEGQIDEKRYTEEFDKIQKLCDEDVVMGEEAKVEEPRPSQSASQARPKPRPTTKATRKTKVTTPLLVVSDDELAPRKKTVSSKGPSEQDEVLNVKEESDAGRSEGEDDRPSKRKRVGELRAVEGLAS